MRTAIALLLAIAGLGLAQDPPQPALVEDLLALLRPHSAGQETCTREEHNVTIAFDARTYRIHRPDRRGRMQRAATELGPERDGVVVRIAIRDQQYGGPMPLPGRLRGPYYETYFSQVEEAGGYLYVRASFGAGFPADLRQRVLERTGAARAVPPPVEVRLIASAVQATYRPGEPIAVRLQLQNGLSQPIRFTTFGTEPAASNAETCNVDLVDIYRDGTPRNLYLARPELRIPDVISGPASHCVEPRGFLNVRVDLAKWTIVGGWTPGVYEVTMRMRNITVDERVTLAVMSFPLRVVVE